MEMKESSQWLHQKKSSSSARRLQRHWPVIYVSAKFQLSTA